MMINQPIIKPKLFISVVWQTKENRGVSSNISNISACFSAAGYYWCRNISSYVVLKEKRYLKGKKKKKTRRLSLFGFSVYYFVLLRFLQIVTHF